MKSLFASRSFVFVLACGLLAGCANPHVVPVATEPDLVSLRIAQAAEKASSALDTIAAIEQHRDPEVTKPQDFSAATEGLQELITVKWTGPIEQMLQALSSRAGLRFQPVGSQPATPVIISVSVYQKPLIEVLRDIGLQAGRRADVSVSDVTSLVELHYAPADRT